MIWSGDDLTGDDLAGDDLAGDDMEGMIRHVAQKRHCWEEQYKIVVSMVS